MGGWGSGRQNGRPLADSSLWIDLAWMVRTNRAVPGSVIRSSLHWTCRGEPSGSISYVADMADPENAWLELSYTRGKGDSKESVTQNVRLTYTTPNYGGRRWWMVCPYRQFRVGKLYLPNGGDRFASRQAWRLGYHSQRQAPRDRPFEALFRLQKKLGCEQGWEQPIRRPKGMWRKTFEQHEHRYFELDEICAVHMMADLAVLRGVIGAAASR